MISEHTLSLRIMEKVTSFIVGIYSITPKILYNILYDDLIKTRKALNKYNKKNLEILKRTYIGALLLKETHLFLESEITESDWNRLHDTFKKLKVH